MSKRIVLTTYGSLGDLHPYMAIALELKKRGHQILIVTSELHRSKIEAEGIEFYPARPNFSLSEIRNEKDKEIIRRVMDSNQGTEYFICEIILPHLRDSFEDLMKAVRGADMLLTHPMAWAGPIVAQKMHIRWASTVLGPISFYSAFDPPVLPIPLSKNLRAFGPVINGLFFLFCKHRVRSWADPVLQLRAELGLIPGKNPLFEGQHSPDLVLALFSQVFAKPQPDWPKQTHVTGFAFFDRKSGKAELPPRLSQFLNAGPPPIVFTLGSAVVNNAGNFYLESAFAAKQLGCRAVLLTGENEVNLPKSLLDENKNIVAFDYAPYSQLFPRSAAIVHQGGIGTTAQALRAGCPMLVMPCSQDQPDNAARAERLGVARTINRTSYTSERVAGELKQLLSNPMYARRAAEIGRQLQAENGVQAACDAIETYLNVSKLKAFQS